MDIFEQIFLRLSSHLPLPIDQIRVISLFLGSIPLGLIHRKIKNPFLRNFYGLIFGLIFQFIVFQNQMLLLLTNTIFIYAIMKLVKKKYCGFVTFCVSLTTLSLIHVHRMMTDYGGWHVDISVSFMMLTCKYSYLSYSYTDSTLPSIPSFLSYLGYIYFFPSCIIGPCFTYEQYDNFICLKNQYERFASPQPPKFYYYIFDQILIGAGFGIMSALFAKKFAMNSLAEEWFGQINILEQILLINFYTFVHRCTYYSGWKLTQAGINASGISYSGTDFSLITTMDINFEIEGNPKNKIDLWNQSVQVWLKKCVFSRVMGNNPKKANLAMNITFMVSAFWHGFYFAYYIAFIQFFLIGSVTKFFFKARNKFAQVDGTGLRILKYIAGQTGMNYIGGTFLLLTWDNVFGFYKNTNFFVPITLVILFLFFSITGWGQRGEQKKEAKKNE